MVFVHALTLLQDVLWDTNSSTSLAVDHTMTIFPIACFLDNYIWCLETDVGLWVVDPGDAAPVCRFLSEQQRPLAGVLITHHHADHTGGVNDLVARHPAPVYGPSEVADLVDFTVGAEECLWLPGLGVVMTLGVGAHTRGHVAYHLPAEGILLCGDTLFSAGCGRLFEGTPADLERALHRINALPAHTRCFPSHEYTLANLAFALTIEPQNSDVLHHHQQVSRWRQQGKPSLPTTLAQERLINPFLRVNEPAVIRAVSQHRGTPCAAGQETLAALRTWKDTFKAH